MDSASNPYSDLRNNAEARLVHKPSTDITTRSAEELLHELEVHQIELEMQNDELRRTHAALEESHDRYMDLYEFAPEGYFTLNNNGLIVEVNFTGAALLLKERKQLLNRRFASFVAQHDNDNWHHHFLNLLKSDGPQSYELELKRSDGSRFNARLDSLLKKTDNASFVRIAITDITERKKAERTQNNLIRSLKLLSEGGMLLIHARNEQELLEEICRLAVETGGYLMAWVGFAEYDTDKVVRPIAQSGYEEGYLNSIKVTWSDTELGQGPTGTAIRTKAAVVNQDCFNNQKMAPWREAALKRGYQSSIALPLLNNDHVLGALTIYSADPYAFNDEEVALLEQLANELTFGIQTLRTRIEHDKTQFALQQSEQRYQGMLEDQTDVICRFKPDTTIVYVNDAFCRLFGKRSEELVGHKWQPVVVPEDLQLLEEQLSTLSPSTPIVTVENRVIDLHGDIRWGQFVNRAFFDKQGNLTEIQSVGRDITDRKQSEDALKLANRRLDFATESGGIGVWDMDLVHDTAWRSLKHDQIFGYESLQPRWNASVGKKHVIPEDQDLFSLCFEEAFRTGKLSLVCRVLHPDQSQHWINAQGRVIYNNAQPVRILGTVEDITERKKVEEALAANEREFRLLAEAMPQIVWITRPDGWNIYFNPQWTDYTGLTLEESYGHGWNKPFHPDDQKRAWDAWQNAVNNHATYSLECRLRRADGEYRWWLVRGVPVLDKTGNIIKWFGTCTDINDIKQYQEQALRGSEERFHVMVNAMPQLGWIARPDGYITWYNDRWYEYTGTTPEQMEGWGWQSVHDPVELPNVLDRWKTSIATGKPFEMTFPLRGADGNFRQFLTRGFPLKNADGDVVQWFGTNTDVEDQTRAEKLLQESEKQHRTLFENMLDGYTHCRMLYENDVPQDFIYLNVNSEFEKQTGLRNVVGKKVSEVIPGIRESNPELIEIFGRVILTGHPEKFEMHVESLEGWFSIAVYSTKNQDFVALFDDISERKRSEQELIVINNQLKHEVVNRTHDLSELAAHIQKIAEIERARLARELHDDMGSIMTALSMEVGRLKGKTSDPDLLQGLTGIRELVSKAIQSKRNIVNQLYPTVLDEYGLVHAVKLMVTEYRKRSGIDVEIVVPEEDVTLAPDYALAAYRITQECLNNIAKHAGASKVQIEAVAKDGFLDLTIHDNGKGMPRKISADRHGIFGMIERARYLGGSMKIGSEEGNGTTLHLRLPLSAAITKNKKRVLVADDHAIVRNALRQLLDCETDDFSVEGEAKDGKDAVEMAIDGAWDLMLLDITMPKKNGIKVLEEIKAVKPELPIIMLSSHSKDEYYELAISKGAVDYIEKGDTDKLVEVMRRVVITN